MSTVIKDLGAATAYGYAVEKGYTGTEAEFAELMAGYAAVGQRAEDAAESALNSKTAAQTAATTATNKASEATTAARTATTKAGEASQSASNANTAKEEAARAKTAAETAQGKAEDAQAAAESVAESIPSDYSQLSEDVSALKEDLNEMQTATAEDVGKVLKAKTVSNGKVTKWEFGTIDTDTVIDVQSMDGMTDTEKLYRFGGEIYYHNGTEWVKVGTGSGGDTSELETLVNSMNNFGTVAEDVDKTSDFVVGYYPADGAVGTKASTTLNGNVNYKGIYVPVLSGETVTLSAKGYSHTTWAFTDNDYNILTKSGYEAYKDEILTAPADGYIFVTTQYTYSYKLILHKSKIITLHDKVDELGDGINEIDKKVEEIPKWLATNILISNPKWGDIEKAVEGAGNSNTIKSITARILDADYALDGDVIYLSVMAKASGNPTKLSLAHGSTNNNEEETAIQNIPTADNWYRLSSIDKQVSTTTPDYRSIHVFATYADASAQNGQTLTYKCGLAFNLTTIFGKGNEPTDPTVIDAMLSQYENGWFSGSQDIWNPSIIKWLAESYKSYMNGTYYGSDGKRFVAGSIIDFNNSQWDHAQASYGMSRTKVPVDNIFNGGIRTNGMVNIFPKYARWEKTANNDGASGVSLFGGHVFEAWNNIRSYRLTMMMGHGGDKVSYTDENGVTHETPREDEACIIVYSPANSYANPPVTPTEEQSKLRINKAQEDYYGESAQNLLGRVRIGGDTPTQGTVFTKNKMITYGRIILADTTQTNKGKQLVFNNDGTITWTEVDLYQHPEPAPTE